jgi:hypothetical protein
MTRIGILISALILLVFASSSHALTFQYSFDGVVGFISGLENNSASQVADSVTVTASPIGGLGEYAPDSIFNKFTVFNGALFVSDTNFVSVTNGNTLMLGPNFGFLHVGTIEFSDSISFSPVTDTRETPLPAALPLFATGLGVLGLLGWRRKRKNAAATA